jgi:hypothetical protein
MMFVSVASSLDALAFLIWKYATLVVIVIVSVEYRRSGPTPDKPFPAAAGVRDAV